MHSIKFKLGAICILVALITLVIPVSADPVIFPGYNIIGTKWYYGTTAPTEDIGMVDDYYLEISNGAIYHKEPTWVSLFNIMGATGAPGAANMTANMTAGPTGDPGAANMTANMTEGPAGAPGAANMTANMTAGPTGAPGAANMTANMTAGPTGAPGAANMTANMTAGPTGAPGAANMTANMTAGPTGAPGAANMTANMTAGATGATGAANLTPNMTANLTAGPSGSPGAANMTANMTAGATGATGAANLTANMTANMTAGAPGANNMTANMTSNMTQGEKGDVGGTAGKVLYMRNSSAADPTTYGGLITQPSGNPEVDFTGTIQQANGKVLIRSYVTELGYPAVAEIPAGLWVFHEYYYLSSSLSATTFVYDVYNRTATGTETLLFTATSDDIDATSTQAYDTYYTQSTPYYISTSDRIVVKVSIQTTRVASTTYHRFTDGTTHNAYIQTPLTSVSANSLVINALSGSNALYRGQAVYISAASGGVPVIDLVDNTITAKTRAVGLVTDSVGANTNTNFIRVGALTNVDTRPTNTALNPLGQTWAAGDLLFAATSGGLTNVRPTSGRSVKCAYDMGGSGQYDTLLAYPFENPVWSTAASGEDIVLRMGDNIGVNKVSFRNYSNSEVGYILSNGTSSFGSGIGSANMTANMTAGPAGSPGADNMTANMTAGPTGAANMTANMTMNQTSNMTQGAPGTSGGTGGKSFYFINQTQLPPPSGFQTFKTLPLGLAEKDEVVTINSGSGEVLISQYISDVGEPGVITVPAGLRQWQTYHYIDDPNGTTQILFYGSIYITADGSEKPSFTGVTTDDINALTPTLYNTHSVNAADYTINITDRIIQRVYARTTSPTNVNVHFVHDGSAHVSFMQTTFSNIQASNIIIDAVAGETIKKGQAVYISGASLSNPVVSLVDNTNSAKIRIIGLAHADASMGAAIQIIQSGALLTVDSRATNANINPLGQTWVTGDLLFVTNGGGLTNVRPTSGRSIKAGYTILGSNENDVIVAHPPIVNPIWSTAASGEDIVLRMGDNIGINKISIRNYSNSEVGYIFSNGTSSFGSGVGSANMTANMTAGPIGLPNLTANMTAGNTGATGAANLTPNMTANLTAGPAGSPGAANMTANMTAGATGATGAANLTPNMTANLTAGPAGSPGAANMTANMTAGATGATGAANLTPNMTANLTAGPSGSPGAANMTANMTAGPAGSPGAANMTANMTAGPAGSPGAANMTANMTAGSPGTPGANNMTPNMTANMTAGPPGGAGDSTGFLFLNGTRQMMGNLDIGKFKIFNSTSSSGVDVTNKTYVDSVYNRPNLSSIYPIGSVYITTTSTNPNTLFEGFGTWNPLGNGYVLVGV